jgi:hypothetical protein
MGVPYYERKTRTFTCGKCSWTGLGSELGIYESYSEIVEWRARRRSERELRRHGVEQEGAAVSGPQSVDRPGAGVMLVERCGGQLRDLSRRDAQPRGIPVRVDCRGVTVSVGREVHQRAAAGEYVRFEHVFPCSASRRLAEQQVSRADRALRARQVGVRHRDNKPPRVNAGRLARNVIHGADGSEGNIVVVFRVSHPVPLVCADVPSQASDRSSLASLLTCQ